MNDPAYRRDLGDGLVLRWSTAADAPRIADVVADVFGSEEKPVEAERASVLETFRPGYPHGGPGDWALVEHLPTGQIVSTTSLMRQTWTYDGIPFAVGRPEQVVTRKPYRDRGLTRAIFELLHARSAARGDLAQVIDGIPYFYRLFGYEYALESFGGVRLYWSAIDAEQVAEEAEPYRLRDATPDDIPLLTRLHTQEQSDSLVSVRVDESYWRWVLAPEGGQDHTSEHGWHPLIIVDTQTHGSVGCIVLRDGYHWSDPSALSVISLSTERGTPLHAMLPSVLRALKRLLPTLPASMTGTPPLRLLLLLGREHPIYSALDAELLSPEPGEAYLRRPYAWYGRVPDLGAFITRIAPALERRLEQSPLSGQSFTLGVSLFRGLVTATFENGRFASALENPAPRGLIPPDDSVAGAAMPRGQFLQLLFGYRSIEELQNTFPDVTAKDSYIQLLETLFPKRYSRPLLIN